jgi:hypothetical protein
MGTPSTIRSRLLEACRQLLDFVPDGGLGLVHWFFVHAFVLRPDGLLVEVRQVFLQTFKVSIVASECRAW